MAIPYRNSSRWRRARSVAVNGSHLVALLRARVSFEKGVMVERPSSRIRGPRGHQRGNGFAGFDWFSLELLGTSSCSYCSSGRGAL